MIEMFNWSQLIGKKVAALRGYATERFGKHCVPLSFVLFDDGKTYLQLAEQDKYDHHDCDSLARVIDVYEDVKEWNSMYNKEG